MGRHSAAVLLSFFLRAEVEVQRLRSAVDARRFDADKRVADGLQRKLRELSERSKALPALQRWFQRHKLARDPIRSWRQTLKVLQLSGRQAEAAASEWRRCEEGKELLAVCLCAGQLSTGFQRLGMHMQFIQHIWLACRSATLLTPHCFPGPLPPQSWSKRVPMNSTLRCTAAMAS